MIQTVSSKYNILGVLVDAVDYSTAVENIITAAKEKRPYGVTALAVHGVMTGALDEIHRHRLNHLHLVVPDGQPVRWALNWLYRTRLTDRVYGPNLALYVCQKAAEEGLPIYFYGSQPTVLDKLIVNLQNRYPSLQIAGFSASKFRQLTEQEQNEVNQQISQSGAAITFVGLGCPRQEVWAYEHMHVLSMPVLAIGAAFDFHAGTLPQSPPSMQKYGLEWLYRLLQDPKRLWHRYLYLNPYYIVLVFLQTLHLKQIPHDSLPRPIESLRYG